MFSAFDSEFKDVSSYVVVQEKLSSTDAFVTLPA